MKAKLPVIALLIFVGQACMAKTTGNCAAQAGGREVRERQAADRLAELRAKPPGSQDATGVVRESKKK